MIGVLALVAALGTAPAASSPDAAPTRPGADGKIAAALLKTFETRDAADFWVVLSAKADTSRAPRTANRTKRGKQVVDALQSTSQRSQAEVLDFLDGEGLRSKAFWITNAVYVKRGTLAAARRIAAMDGVREIRAPKVYAPPKPVASRKASAKAAGPEWGVTNIKADAVWKEYGKRGEDIVVANIDTGVQVDHPALAASYRGRNADGTVTHDYNWFDASGRCDGAPCDSNGHGTHTMGTIAGDDGEGNQIGVAPGVRWIAANGCATCTEADLVASGQWMLAPTDADGRNPDVSKRPHIVNNSWGSSSPTDEPLMEDVLEAWAASGIMGIWANGNSGPACKTSGSPGSRLLTYSVGAYDQDNAIASFSSRGPGQDGRLKPNVSAPGVDVRSAIPGSAYGVMSGTSMATPHVAGAVALLWSAEPEYARDLDATRTLLDLTSIDTLDEQCGGTSDDNNAFGEGRLDALSLIRAGKAGLGTLSGTVTDAATGEPVADAAVSATAGTTTEETRTASDGTYVLRLPAGDYQQTVSGFGYQPKTVSVRVDKDGTTDQDVALDPTPRVGLTGVVRDGSGQGWPLYAKVTASDGDGHTWTTHTDPATGGYRLDLLPSTRYTLEARAVRPGYEPTAAWVDVGTTDQTADLSLIVAIECTAPGYHVVQNGTTEPFTRARPRGWTVTNVDPHYPGYDARPGWVYDNPAKRPNKTGGSGGFAIVDSDHSGQSHVQNTFLTSPTVNMTGRKNPAIEFAHDLRPAVNSTAAVDLSVDGGRTWATVWHDAGFPGAPGPARKIVPLPQAVGKAGVKVRFHYLGQWSGWWAVDDVFVGDRTCEPVAGALLTGRVSDAAGGDGIVGAAVTSEADPAGEATTIATPDDPGQDDGLYWLFSAATGEQRFTASKEGYGSSTQTVTLTPGRIAVSDFGLAKE
ncbi:S8 family serine peptidase [Actinomadura madurae]|uniref:S8 family serine peptidase n=1 Tax=Actinomadura madurae TaxID=1993 RepID=UPI0020D21C94|nr:S8 family serine peptidase [Actinomadura madurae]MCP9967486.1 S8 family serine peptidase [Actinomadura madurae]